MFLKSLCNIFQKKKQYEALEYTWLFIVFNFQFYIERSKENHCIVLHGADNDDSMSFLGMRS